MNKRDRILSTLDWSFELANTRFYTYAVIAVNIKHSDSFKTLCHLFTRILRGFFYLQSCFCISVLVDHKGWLRSLGVENSS